MQKDEFAKVPGNRQISRKNGGWRVKAFLTEIFLIRRRGHVFSLAQKSFPRYLYCLCIFLTFAPKNRITALLVLDQFSTSSGAPLLREKKILLRSFNLFGEVPGRFFSSPATDSSRLCRNVRKATLGENNCREGLGVLKSLATEIFLIRRPMACPRKSFLLC